VIRLSILALVLLATALPAATESPRPRQDDRYVPLPISKVTAMDAGGRARLFRRRVQVEGVATVHHNTFYRDRFKVYLQDPTGGVALFSRQGRWKVEPGSRLRVSGVVRTYGGSVEIHVDRIDILGRGAAPSPIVVPPEKLLSREYSGRLVTTEGRIVETYERPRWTEHTLATEDGLLTIHLTNDQRPAFKLGFLEPGATIRVSGIATPFRGSSYLRWQILPRSPEDIRLVRPAPIIPREQFLIFVGVGLALILVTTAWILLLRRQVRIRTRDLGNALAETKIFAHTIASAKDLISVTDLDEKLTFVNDAFASTYGYSREELIGRHVSILDSPRNSPALREEISRAAHRDGWSGTLWNRRKDGSDLQIALNTSVIRDEKGEGIGLVGVAQDISESMEIQQRLRESEERYRLLFEKNPLPMWLYDEGSRRILSVNEAALKKYLYGAPEYEQLDIDVLCDRSVETAASLTAHRKRSGELILVETSDLPLRQEGSKLRLLVANDVTERARAQEAIEHQAFHDGLTGLPNRRLFVDRLTQQIAHARRAGASVVVMFVDLDRFKRINDTLGHWAGDEVLREISRRLTGSLRQTDTIARVGGDEFTVLLAQSAEIPMDSVETLANKVMREFEAPIHLESGDIYVTASIGIATFPNDGDDADQLMKNSDRAMYRAKERGRNNYQLAQGTDDHLLRDGFSLENDLHHAIRENQLRLYYQPQVEVATGQVVGAEALLRWEHPTRGLLYPKDFLDLAEESLTILPIGEWVIDTACRQLRDWSDQGLHIGISVNLSARQFERSRLRDTIASAITRYAIPPALLELEITEHLAMRDVAGATTTLHQLRDLGVRIAMDDFGTGHSALGRLKDFPLDTLKVDRAFVRDLDAGESNAAIVAAIISIGRGLGMRVIAEGVETDGQVSYLLRNGCGIHQGFRFSPALPEQVFVEYLRNGNAAEFVVRDAPLALSTSGPGTGGFSPAKY
jgi:diguanylate cyclase (GGDEF)-like protein/PAS domain S-box-containing protein